MDYQAFGTRLLARRILLGAPDAVPILSAVSLSTSPNFGITRLMKKSFFSAGFWLVVPIAIASNLIDCCQPKIEVVLKTKTKVPKIFFFFSFWLRFPYPSIILITLPVYLCVCSGRPLSFPFFLSFNLVNLSVFFISIT
jgi:hypothetical protein